MRRRGVSLVETMAALVVSSLAFLGAASLLETGIRALARASAAGPETVTSLPNAVAVLTADAAASASARSGDDGGLELGRPDGSRSLWRLAGGTLTRTPVDASGTAGRARVVARGLTRFRAASPAPALVALELAAPGPRSWLGRKRPPESRASVVVALRGAGREGSW